MRFLRFTSLRFVPVGMTGLGVLRAGHAALHQQGGRRERFGKKKGPPTRRWPLWVSVQARLACVSRPC